MLSPVSWSANGVRIIDQTLLPDEEVWLELGTVDQVFEAICQLSVRGAPAIGITAALGCALAAKTHSGDDPQALVRRVRQAADLFASSRPTAVNLFWALDRMRKKMDELLDQDAITIRKALLQEALRIRLEDIRACQAIGKNGAILLPDECNLLTHCNAGALATGGYGTALGIVRAAAEAGKRIQVFADETRPLLQGARLTAWELMREGIAVTLICDNMAGYLMRLGRITACLVGADRIAANGDTANKIGTYSLAVLAHRHGIPFYVAAPISTVDLSLPSGEQIPIEERDPSEITTLRGTRFAPANVPVFNPAFDVTPASLIQAIITERGVAASPGLGEQLQKLAALPPLSFKKQRQKQTAQASE